MFLKDRGCKATWGVKQTANVKRLLKQHGIEEVMRRMKVCFDSPPEFPSSPDFMGFAQHFDLFSGKSKSKGKRLSVAQIIKGSS
jgi:hypothetical protein